MNLEFQAERKPEKLKDGTDTETDCLAPEFTALRSGQREFINKERTSCDYLLALCVECRG